MKRIKNPFLSAIVIRKMYDKNHDVDKKYGIKIFDLRGYDMFISNV